MGIVKVTVRKISQTVRRWHVSKWGWVRPDTGAGRVSRGELGTVDNRDIVIQVLLNILDQMDLVVFIRGEGRFYTLEQKGALLQGRLRRLLHPDACARSMEPLDVAAKCDSQKGIPISHQRISLTGGGG